MPKKEYPTTTPDWRAAARRRSRFYALIAVLLSILFGLLVYQFFVDQQAAGVTERIPILFASEFIPAGTFLREDLLQVKKISTRAVPQSHYSHPAQAVGRMTLYPIIEGEMILPEKLAKGQGGIAAQRCPVNRWCVSIPLNWFIAIPQHLSEGDRVEIASAHSGAGLEAAGYIASDVQVVEFSEVGEAPAILLAVESQEALHLLYARVNEYQLLILVRPAGG